MPWSHFTDKYRFDSGREWTRAVRPKKPAGQRASGTRSGASVRSSWVCRCSLNTLIARGEGLRSSARHHAAITFVT